MNRWPTLSTPLRICGVKIRAATFACRVLQRCAKLLHIMNSERTRRLSRISNHMHMRPCSSRSDYRLAHGKFPALVGALLLTLLLAASPALSGESTPPHVSAD